jgi:hypothetical protein
VDPGQADSGVTAVSVILPVFNGEAHVREAVASVLAQTHREFELVVVDDGSSDGTGEILASFDDSRLRVVRQDNAGLVASLNRGLREADHEFVARMDADDVSHPERLACQVALLEEEPGVALVASCFAVISDQGVQRIEHVPSGRGMLARQLFFRNVVPHGGAMFRRTPVLDLGGYRRVGPCEDYDLWARLVREHEVASIPRVLFGYRISPGGVSAQAPDEQRECTRRVRAELWGGASPERVTARSVRAEIDDRLDRHRMSLGAAARSVGFDHLGAARQAVRQRRVRDALPAIAAIPVGAASAAARRSTVRPQPACADDLPWWSAR